MVGLLTSALILCFRRVAVPSDGRVVRGRRRAVVEEGEAGGEGAPSGPQDLPRRRRTRAIGELLPVHGSFQQRKTTTVA